MSDRKIIDYAIIQHNNYSTLSIEVASLIINHNWQPYGFPSFPVEDAQYAIYTQAMVKYE